MYSQSDLTLIQSGWTRFLQSVLAVNPILGSRVSMGMVHRVSRGVISLNYPRVLSAFAGDVVQNKATLERMLEKQFNKPFKLIAVIGQEL